MRYLIKVTVMLLLSAVQLAIHAAPVPHAHIILSDRSGRTDTLYVGDNGTSSFEAPLSVVFDAGMTGVEPGTSVFCEWRVLRTYMEDGVQMEEDYLTRQEELSQYVFEDDGNFTVSFAYSYREKDSSEIISGEEQDDISFSIDVSDMYVPNAFSPNGDGKNDVFKVRVKSIVSFKVTIFNRWGKIVASGDESTLEYEAGNDNNGYYICWDGNYNGSVAPDGVYFINIEAEGAGGKRYSRKSDINVLTGLGNQNGSGNM